MKGILFKPDMRKAIVENRKTVTRRLDNLKEINQEPDRWELIEWKYTLTAGFAKGFFFERDDGLQRVIKPRYQVGDVVYIKEAWTYITLAEKDPWKERAEKDGSFRRMPNGDPVSVWYKASGVEIGTSWSTPLFMPAWAARTFLQITDVRTERLQEITEEDAEKEGFKPEEYNNPDAYADFPCTNQFIETWNRINPKYSWSSNPWVWRYSFDLAESVMRL